MKLRGFSIPTSDRRGRQKRPKLYTYGEAREQSEAERKMNMPGRLIKRGLWVPPGYTGEQLRRMRKKNGVGRPPKIRLNQLAMRELLKHLVLWDREIADKVNEGLRRTIGLHPGNFRGYAIERSKQALWLGQS
jgi:hypothetical protein